MEMSKSKVAHDVCPACSRPARRRSRVCDFCSVRWHQDCIPAAQAGEMEKWQCTSCVDSQADERALGQKPAPEHDLATQPKFSTDCMTCGIRCRLAKTTILVCDECHAPQHRHCLSKRELANADLTPWICYKCSIRAYQPRGKSKQTPKKRKQQREAVTNKANVARPKRPRHAADGDSAEPSPGLEPPHSLNSMQLSGSDSQPSDDTPPRPTESHGRLSRLSSGLAGPDRGTHRSEDEHCQSTGTHGRPRPSASSSDGCDHPSRPSNDPQRRPSESQGRPKRPSSDPECSGQASQPPDDPQRQPSEIQGRPKRVFIGPVGSGRDGEVTDDAQRKPKRGRDRPRRMSVGPAGSRQESQPSNDTNQQVTRSQDRPQCFSVSPAGSGRNGNPSDNTQRQPARGQSRPRRVSVGPESQPFDATHHLLTRSKSRPRRVTVGSEASGHQSQPCDDENRQSGRPRRVTVDGPNSGQQRSLAKSSKSADNPEIYENQRLTRRSSQRFSESKQGQLDEDRPGTSLESPQKPLTKVYNESTLKMGRCGLRDEINSTKDLTVPINTNKDTDTGTKSEKQDAQGSPLAQVDDKQASRRCSRRRKTLPEAANAREFPSETRQEESEVVKSAPTSCLPQEEKKDEGKTENVPDTVEAPTLRRGRKRGISAADENNSQTQPDLQQCLRCSQPCATANCAVCRICKGPAHVRCGTRRDQTLAREGKWICKFCNPVDDDMHKQTEDTSKNLKKRPRSATEMVQISELSSKRAKKAGDDKVSKSVHVWTTPKIEILPDCNCCGKLIPRKDSSCLFCLDCSVPIHRSCLPVNEESSIRSGKWLCLTCLQKRRSEAGGKKPSASLAGRPCRICFSRKGMAKVAELRKCETCDAVSHLRCVVKSRESGPGVYNCSNCVKKSSKGRSKAALPSTNEADIKKSLSKSHGPSRERLDLSEISAYPPSATRKPACAYCHKAGSVPGVQGILVGPIGDPKLFVHSNCAKWDSRALFYRKDDLQRAVQISARHECSVCKRDGAALLCLFKECEVQYHFHCALADQASFVMDPKFGVICRDHTEDVKNIVILDDAPFPYLIFDTHYKPSIDPEITCSVCSIPEGFSSDMGQLIVCCGCKKTAHRFCRPHTRKSVIRPRSSTMEPYEYYCLDCQTCGHCEKSVTSTKYKECAACHVLLHNGLCLEPHLVRPEDTRLTPWVCRKCVTCSHCDKPTVCFETAILDDFPVCFGCSQEVVQRNFCPVCSRCYKEDDTHPMVECGVCKLWTHFYCAEVFEVDYYAERDFVCRACIDGYQPKIKSIIQSPVETLAIENATSIVYEDTAAPVQGIGIPFLTNPDASRGEQAGASAELCRMCCSSDLTTEHMRFCCDCGEAYHTFCFHEIADADSPVAMTARRRHYNLQAGRNGTGKPFWRCQRCTVCEICNSSEREASIILCDGCDKGFHQNCLVPALTSIPDGLWLCSECRSCQLCGKEPCASIGGADLCKSCAEEFPNEKLCSICEESWTAGASLAGPRLLKCKNCRCVAHPACAGLVNDAAHLFDGDVNHYFCQKCKLAGYGSRPFSFGEIPLDCLLDRIRGEPTSALSFECLQVGNSQIFIGLSAVAKDRIKAIEIGDASAIRNITGPLLQSIPKRVSEPSAITNPTLKSGASEQWTNVNPTSHVSHNSTGDRCTVATSLSDSKIGDTRMCSICRDDSGDSGRLLFAKSLVWVHIGCVLWSSPMAQVRKTSCLDLPLSLVTTTIKNAGKSICGDCGEYGASVGCDETSCETFFHLDCVLSRREPTKWQFQKNGFLLCHEHQSPQASEWRDVLCSSRPYRIEWDLSWQRSRAGEETGELMFPLPWSMIASFADVGVRVGSLTVVRLGTLQPDSRFIIRGNAIPLAYEAIRLFWSGKHAGERCQYTFRVTGSRDSGPTFCISASDCDDLSIESSSIEEAWAQVLDRVESIRRNQGVSVRESVWRPGYLLKAFEAFGLSLGAVVSLLERQPGSKLLPNYVHKYVSQGELRKLDGRIEQIHRREAVQTLTGSARSEGYERKTHFSTGPLYRGMKIDEEEIPVKEASVTTDGNTALGLPVALQHRNMLKTWKKRTAVRRSGIEGLGLYATETIEAGSMIIEYAGELFRPILADARERYYDSRGKGTYMFRVDDYNIVDATMKGNWARFINHSCDPNCKSQRVTVEWGRKAIVIVSLRRVNPGEELSYDYKFPLEDEKLPCTCGAEKCRGTLN